MKVYGQAMVLMPVKQHCWPLARRAKKKKNQRRLSASIATQT